MRPTFYENLVYRAGDDGIETDGVCSNIRLWENTIHDALIGISVSPTYTGPVYALRNVIYNTGAGNNQHTGTAFKFMYPTSSDGAVYLFHNTTDALLPGHSGLIVGGEAGTWETIVARNNIWAGAHYALARFTAAQLVDFDSGATGIRITNNELFRSAIDSEGDCSAVSLVGHGNFTNLLIEGNVVREDVGQAKPTCWGIAVDAGYESSERFENVRIRGNQVINVGSLGIGVSACVDCVIENNVVIHEQPYGTTAVGVPSKNPGPGDAVTTGITVRNNSIYATSPDWGIGIRVDSEGAGHTIVSNAMEYGGTSDWWSCLEADLPASSYDAIDYNVCGYSAGIWANWVGDLSDWQALGWGAHSQAANPGFTSAWDLSPVSIGAASVDAGHPTLSSLTGIYGYPRDSAPDAGAYEWGAGAACYDVTNDDQITIADVQTVAGRWHDLSQYRFAYDVVPDGVIDVRDMMQMAAHLGQQCQSASGFVRRQGN